MLDLDTQSELFDAETIPSQAPIVDRKHVADIVTFEVPGSPKAKARHRSFYNQKLKRIINYTDAKTKNNEAFIRMVAQQYFNEPYEGPICMRIVFYMPIAQSWTKKKKAAALKGELRPTTKPDMDNLEKQVKDALNGIAWNDDSQVVSKSTTQFYSSVPKTIISVGVIKYGA